MEGPVVAVVLAGGTGTRLYPATRSDRPKQFLSLLGERSLLERTVDRVDFADEVFVLTRGVFAEEVAEHAPDATVLIEPEPKDTGPALAYAAHRVRERVGACTLVCLPSDHHVEGDFAGTFERAARVASETDRLVTVGVEPDRPATGYGYVEPGESMDGYETVASFHEKPDADVARQYVESGYYWNAGIFAWTAEAFLAAARESPLASLVEAMDRGDAEAGFSAVEAVSVDYAVMERADDVAVVPADFEWDDIGTWDAVARHLAEDAQGNAVAGDALAIDAADNVIATDGHVSVIGVEDLIVASYGDRTVVCPVDDAQRVREVVTELDEDDLF